MYGGVCDEDCLTFASFVYIYVTVQWTARAERLNSFMFNVLFLSSLKSKVRYQNPLIPDTIFCCFQGRQKGNIGLTWIKIISFKLIISVIPFILLWIKKKLLKIPVFYCCWKLSNTDTFCGMIHFWDFDRRSFGRKKHPPEVIVRKGVLRNFAKFTGKHLCQSLFFNKVTYLRPAILLKKRLWYRCFPVNFEKFLRAPFWQNNSGGCLWTFWPSSEFLQRISASLTTQNQNIQSHVQSQNIFRNKIFLLLVTWNDAEII